MHVLSVAGCFLALLLLQVVDRVLAVCPNLTQQQQLVASNLNLLRSLNSDSAQVRRLVLSTPHVLTAPVQPWQEFLSAYGLQDSQIWRVLVNQPRLLLHGSIFCAGRAMMFLRQLGWSELEVLTMVIQHPEHSNILLVSDSCSIFSCACACVVHV
jgi:hypothetical protein